MLECLLSIWTTPYNLFIYQARGVYPGPSRDSDCPVSAESIIYEAIVLMSKKNMEFYFIALREKIKIKASLFVILLAF